MMLGYTHHETTLNNTPNLGSLGYFWSHQFGFTSAPTNGGAYIGIQGIDTAIFSIFDWPSTQASSACKVYQSGFDGGAYSFGGTSCLINYKLTQGDTYQTMVTKVGQDANGIEWQGSVTNLTTGVKTIIATVAVPASWGDISNSSIVWTEYFPANSKPIASCASLPPSNVTFSNFTGSNASGSYSISSSSDSITQNACSNFSNITDNSHDSFTQQMGVKNSPQATPTSTSPKAPSTSVSVPSSNKTNGSSQTLVACDSKSSFLDFPTWYEYLQCNSDNSPILNNINDIWLIVAAIIEILLRVAALVAVGIIIFAGVEYTTSQGEPEKTGRALKTIISAAIGLAICVLAAVIVSFIAGSFN